MPGQGEHDSGSTAPASKLRIPWGTRNSPAKPIAQVVKVNNLVDLTENWTNDTSDMYLNVYFNAATSNLSMSYNIEGLQPIIREKNGTIFLLKDINDNFFKWDCEEAGLYLINEAHDLESALDLIIYHPIMMKITRYGHNKLGNRTVPEDAARGG